MPAFPIVVLPYKLSLQRQLRTPLTLLATVFVDRDLSRIERTIHTILASARIQGEWFYLSMSGNRLAALVDQARTTLLRTDREQASRCLRRNVQLGMHHPTRPLTQRQREVLGVSLDWLAGRKETDTVAA